MTSNTAKRFLQLGQAIIKQRGLVFTYQQAVDVMRDQIAKRQADLRPRIGWAGKNEDERKADKLQYYAQDATLVSWEKINEKSEDSLRNNQFELQCLLDEQQALSLALDVERTDLVYKQWHDANAIIDLAETWDELSTTQQPSDEAPDWEPEDDGIDSPVVVGNIYLTDEERLVPGSSQDDEDIPF